MGFRRPTMTSAVFNYWPKVCGMNERVTLEFPKSTISLSGDKYLPRSSERIVIVRVRLSVFLGIFSIKRGCKVGFSACAIERILNSTQVAFDVSFSRNFVERWYSLFISAISYG